MLKLGRCRPRHGLRLCLAEMLVQEAHFAPLVLVLATALEV
jgi:hypothetical protein